MTVTVNTGLGRVNGIYSHNNKLNNLKSNAVEKIKQETNTTQLSWFFLESLQRMHFTTYYNFTLISSRVALLLLLKGKRPKHKLLEENHQDRPLHIFFISFNKT